MDEPFLCAAYVIKNGSEFIGDDDIDDFKLLGLKSKINDISRIVDKLKSEQNTILGENTNDYAEYLDNIIRRVESSYRK